MCFAHSGTPSDVLHVQAGVGVDAAEAFTALAEADGLGSVEVIGSGTPDTVVAPRGERVLDGFSRVMHNRWNRDLEPAVTVRPGEEIQLLCRDALDIGDQARTLTADGSMTLDLGRIHPLTGPVHVEGAEPAAWAATPTSGNSSPVRGCSCRSTSRARGSRRATGTWPRVTARSAVPPRDAHVRDAAIRRHQGHDHHRAPRHRPGGRPDPARHAVRRARPGLLHHDRGRSGPDGERQERRPRDDRLARR